MYGSTPSPPSGTDTAILTQTRIFCLYNTTVNTSFSNGNSDLSGEIVWETPWGSRSHRRNPNIVGPEEGLGKPGVSARDSMFPTEPCVLRTFGHEGKLNTCAQSVPKKFRDRLRADKNQ